MGGLAKSRGLVYGASENHSKPECGTPCWASRPVSLLESCSLRSGTTLCLCLPPCKQRTALQFSLAPLMLSNKFSQSSRTKGEGKQSLHMKRGQRHQVRAPAEVLPSRAVSAQPEQTRGLIPTDDMYRLLTCQPQHHTHSTLQSSLNLAI